MKKTFFLIFSTLMLFSIASAQRSELSFDIKDVPLIIKGSHLAITSFKAKQNSDAEVCIRDISRKCNTTGLLLIGVFNGKQKVKTENKS